MRRLGISAFLLTVLVSSACRTPAPTLAADKEPIPADLKIVAGFGAGESRWKSWQSTISADGKIIQEILVGDGDPLRTLPRLSSKDLRDLLAAVKKADFFAMKREHDSPAEDQVTLDLTVTRGGLSHQVYVYGPWHFKDDPEVKRFIGVWDSFLKKVPSPNPDQKPGLYAP